jgi:hypothetical protein
MTSRWRFAAPALMLAAFVLPGTAPAQSAGRAPASGAASGTALPAVTTSGMRDPIEKSYRRMLRGMDVFERERAQHAPGATLRYKLLPRKHSTDMRSLALYVVGSTVDVPVPLAPDGTFTLERLPKAAQEDAVVTTHRKALTLTWRTEIRTPGLPPDTRRLGDMRLECLVGMEAGLVSNPSTLVTRLASDLFDSPATYCGKKQAHYLFFAERPIFSVTLEAGARREILPVDWLYAEATDDPGLKGDLPFCDCEVLVDRTYFLPLGDASWPDDTLIRFEYMEDGNAPAKP